MAERDPESAGIQVEVVYALPAITHQVMLELAPGSSIAAAVRQSGLLERCPEISPDQNRVGVFGQLRQWDDPLADGDRVEIYRPLQMDPKEARRRRAARGRER